MMEKEILQLLTEAKKPLKLADILDGLAILGVSKRFVNYNTFHASVNRKLSNMIKSGILINATSRKQRYREYYLNTNPITTTSKNISADLDKIVNERLLKIWLENWQP